MTLTGIITRPTRASLQGKKKSARATLESMSDAQTHSQNRLARREKRPDGFIPSKRTSPMSDFGGEGKRAQSKVIFPTIACPCRA
jgi:hypothetical protein